MVEDNKAPALTGLPYDITGVGGAIGPALHGFLPHILENASDIEETGHLPADMAASLARMDAFNIMKTDDTGGAQLSALDCLKLISTVACADASTGWCMMIAATSTLASAYMPLDTARHIFGDPHGIVGGVFAPMGRAEDKGDHYVLTGRWQWGSGSANCNWMAGGAMIHKDGELQRLENGAPDHRMLFFPADQAALADNWHVAGLKGTGSQDFAVEGLQVPKDRSVSFITDAPRHSGALYTFPLFGLLALGVSSVALGNASGALAEIIALAKAKKTTGGGRSIAQRATVQADIARAQAQLSGAYAYAEQAVALCWQEAQQHGAISLTAKGELRLACAHATEVAAQVCKICYTIGGGSAVYLSNSLQRRFRDAHVATQHIATAPAVFELAGRMLVDEPVDDATL